MKVCFNVHNVGLNNNGGSRTLIRCVETLVDLGYNAFFWSGPIRYSWHKHHAPRIGGDIHPKADVSIATGYNSWIFTYKSNSRIKCYYIRGLELWKTPEKNLLASFKKMPHVFVNSQWLLDYMKSHGIQAKLQYPGLDLNWFKDLDDSERRGVGALRNTRHRTKRHDHIDHLEELLGQPIHQLNRHIKHPSPTQLNLWYNKLKVWFAPTELEGLHNPPMEAGLAGCALVCTDHPRSGMQDYAIHGKTALVYPAGNIKKAKEYVELLLNDEDLRRELNENLKKLLITKISSRETQMTNFVNKLKEIS